MELMKATTNIAFLKCVLWCGVIGPYVFPQRLTGNIYANFLQDELPALLESVPLQTR